ncbi:MAG: hypothetical protein AAGD14_19390 [Planctomycetota bacterium]
MSEGSQFLQSIRELAGKKVRFYTGGGDRGFVQGPVARVDGDLIYIEKQGDIKGTLYTLTLHATAVRYYEIDKLVDTE